MCMTDPIADMLTRIRNAGMAKHEKVEMPASKLKINIAKVLKEEGYIEDFEVSDDKVKPVLTIHLKYLKGKIPVHVIEGIKRISKPGRRIYKGWEELKPVRNGLGIAIVSTSRGVMSDRMCRKLRIGGEVICEVW